MFPGGLIFLGLEEITNEGLKIPGFLQVRGEGCSREFLNILKIDDSLLEPEKRLVCGSFRRARLSLEYPRWVAHNCL